MTFNERFDHNGIRIQGECYEYFDHRSHRKYWNFIDK